MRKTLMCSEQDEFRSMLVILDILICTVVGFTTNNSGTYEYVQDM